MTANPVVQIINTCLQCLLVLYKTTKLCLDSYNDMFLQMSGAFGVLWYMYLGAALLVVSRYMFLVNSSLNLLFQLWDKVDLFAFQSRLALSFLMIWQPLWLMSPLCIDVELIRDQTIRWLQKIRILLKYQSKSICIALKWYSKLGIEGTSDSCIMRSTYIYSQNELGRRSH